MTFDLSALRYAVARHGRVARVVVAAVLGSAPREVGASMLVWEGGQSGTIGGGTLEHEAAKAALGGERRLSRHALGPDLGQCCGGAVQLLTEHFDADRLALIDAQVFARPVADAAEMPMRVARICAQARGQGLRPEPQLIDGWMVETILAPARQIWVWGAGHVGRALVQVLAPLPDLEIIWVDTHRDRFPDVIPAGVDMLVAGTPADLVPHAPAHAEHLIVTYSHALDLELCNRLLLHCFSFTGLIGSATKWARFRARLRDLGHSEAQIQRITCPIGAPELGKHPQAIAIGVATSLLDDRQDERRTEDRRA